MAQLAPLQRDEMHEEIPVEPVRRSRARRWSARLGTIAATCAMGSWALLVVIPVLVILSWLTDLHLS